MITSEQGESWNKVAMIVATGIHPQKHIEVQLEEVKEDKWKLWKEKKARLS
jgi:hypothetical protein